MKLITEVNEQMRTDRDNMDRAAEAISEDELHSLQDNPTYIMYGAIINMLHTCHSVASGIPANLEGGLLPEEDKSFSKVV